jgi:hypothetical protein
MLLVSIKNTVSWKSHALDLYVQIINIQCAKKCIHTLAAHNSCINRQNYYILQ